MGVIAEPIKRSILLRCGPGMIRYGDPYSFCVSVAIRENRTAYLFGACGRTYIGMRKEIREKLVEMGFERVMWERRRNGEIKKVTSGDVI